MDGKHVLTLPLCTDRVARFSAGGVQMSLEVRDGRVRVLESTCPHQVCVKTGWIDRPGQVIVCVPARMVITVGRSGQAPSGSMAGADGGPSPKIWRNRTQLSRCLRQKPPCRPSEVSGTSRPAGV